MQFCTEIISFEKSEVVVLQRLTEHILPFRTTEGRGFSIYIITISTEMRRRVRIRMLIGWINRSAPLV